MSTFMQFARLGARLVLWDIDESANEETKKLIQNIGAEVCLFYYSKEFLTFFLNQPSLVRTLCHISKTNSLKYFGAFM